MLKIGTLPSRVYACVGGGSNAMGIFSGFFDDSERGSAMRKRSAAFAFYAISVVLFPITLFGYVIWIGKLLIGKSPGVSTTAQGPLSARWTMHNLGVREDEA